MKSSLKKVYSKLSKEKVNLSNISELKRASDMLTIDNTDLQMLETAKESQRTFIAALNSAITAAKNYTVDFEDITSAYFDQSNAYEVGKVLNDFAYKAQEIGLEAESIPEFNMLEQQLAELDAFESDVESFVDSNRGEYEAAVEISQYA